MKEEIIDILELGIKDDGKSFYNNEEKTELLIKLIKSKLPSAIDLARECDYDCGGVYFDYGEEFIIEQLCK